MGKKSHESTGIYIAGRMHQKNKFFLSCRYGGMMTKGMLCKMLVVVSLTIPLSVKAQASTSAQPGTTSSAIKDPAALAIVARGLSAAGGDKWANVRDFQIVAQTTLWNFAPHDWPILISGRRTGEYRVELNGNGPNSNFVEIRKGAIGQRISNKAVAQTRHQYNTVSDPIYFPLPFLAEIVSSSQIAISSKGTVSLNGRNVDQVDVNSVYPTQTTGQHSYLDRFTHRSLFFDSGTGVLVRISDYLYSDIYASSRLPRSIDFSDYQTEQNLTFPHLIEEHVGLRPFNTIEVRSIVLNSGIPNSSFVFQH
jgi:hypothetical protein